ncbi:MAG: DegT/DnrJ/EryC1/StrS family aminotransferase [Methyloceanibacter sp.]
MNASNRTTDQGLRPLAFIDLAAQQERIKARIEAAVAEVLAGGQYVLGPHVEALESALADFCGASHCVSCANGTDALSLVLMAEGVGPGDAVFVPSFTFVATAEAVADRGATPVFVDIDADSFNMNTASLERAIGAARKAGLKPRMVIAVDLFGQPADYDRLAPVAHEHGVLLVADAAQSFGAMLDGKRVGTLAPYSTTSFFPAKPLGCYGDGGAVLVEDSAKANILRSLASHGTGSHRYEHVRVGLNSRLDSLQAAILLVKLDIFPDEIEARQTVARRYGELLRGVSTPHVRSGATSVWAQYTVGLPEGTDRDAVQAHCASAGVPTAVYYPIPLHKQQAYSQHPCDPEGLPQTEAAAPRVLSLPMHPYLSAAKQAYVAETLAAALRACSG